jgi:hypothetical protein
MSLNEKTILSLFSKKFEIGKNELDEYATWLRFLINNIFEEMMNSNKYDFTHNDINNLVAISVFLNNITKRKS